MSAADNFTRRSCADLGICQNRPDCEGCTSGTPSHWKTSSMPGVLIDESDSAGPDTRALFYAHETPTQADIIRTAHWLGVDPLQHAFNLDLNFAELEPGDLAALGYTLPPADQRPAIQDDEDFPTGPLSPLQAIGLVLLYGWSLICVAVAAGYIWQRWGQGWFAS